MKQIIVDSNLLVLLVVGLTDPNQILKHRRTNEFEIADYDLLTSYLSNFDEIIVTPHILTETSNLLKYTNQSLVPSLRATLSILIDSQKEEFEYGSTISKHTNFVRLGLADCAILRLVENKIPLITTDFDLYWVATYKIGINATNFTHLRQNRLLDI